MSNIFHEVAMLAAQVWGECNGEGADPEQFGVDVAVAYSGAFGAMESDAHVAAYSMELAADPFAESSAHEVMRNIITKQAK